MLQLHLPDEEPIKKGEPCHPLWALMLLKQAGEMPIMAKAALVRMSAGFSVPGMCSNCTIPAAIAVRKNSMASTMRQIIKNVQIRHEETLQTEEVVQIRGRNFLAIVDNKPARANDPDGPRSSGSLARAGDPDGPRSSAKFGD